MLVPIGVVAGTIKGYVYDVTAGAPLAGATVHLEPTGKYATSGLDGSFTINNIPEGTYTITVNYVSFKTFTIFVEINKNKSARIVAEMVPNKENRLKEIIVKGKETPGKIASVEQSASQIVNVVSSREIKISPDVTVANVVQRVPGVSIERDDVGEGEFPILRGMDKRYNYTLINGVKIPSPDRDNRYVPLDIFPSELLERLEVYKTLTPSMEGDAVGGVVNMVMKDAPDSFGVDANISTGYNDIFFNRNFMSFNHKQIKINSPYEVHVHPYNATTEDFSSGPVSYQNKRPAPDVLAGFTIGNRFLKKKLGVLLATNFQNTYKGSNGLFFESDVVDTLKGVTLTSMQKRNFSEQEFRYAVYSKIDYRLKNQNKIEWNNSFMNLTEFQIRDVKSTLLTIGGYDPSNGNAALLYDTRSRTSRQHILNSNLHGDFQLHPLLRLNWSAVYSRATNAEPDEATIILNGEQKNFIATKTTVKNAWRRWQQNTDRDLTGCLNLIYDKSIFAIPVEWRVGGLYRDKRRANFYDEYQFRPEDPYAKMGEDFNDYNQIQWILENPRGSVGTSLNYKAFEKTAAEYFQFKTSSPHFEITGGVRFENTNQGYNLDFPIGQDNPNGRQIYTDVLPSLNLKFMPQRKIVWRASYFRSINRPGFFEIVPYTIVNEDYVERGNPALKHAVADNLDLRFEAYLHPSEQFMAGVFYKHIQNPIEYILKADSIRGQDIYYTPGNFGNAENYGAEISFIKYFHKIGIKANYTYTHSRITTPKSKRIRDDDGNLKTISVEQTRPLYGQSAHIANASLLYKDMEKGWDGQLALQYTGSRINSVSQFVGNDLWQKAFIQMDASLSKNFKSGFSIFAKSNNLLNTPMIVFIKNTSFKNAQVPNQPLAGKTLINQNYYQRSYYVGIRYSL
ncbi:MAG TPA: TonB-dependent receptor [Hanamia sp.]|nr:TonB-dependent receptor [Hanamia sp.]